MGFAAGMRNFFNKTHSICTHNSFSWIKVRIIDELSNCGERNVKVIVRITAKIRVEGSYQGYLHEHLASAVICGAQENAMFFILVFDAEAEWTNLMMRLSANVRVRVVKVRVRSGLGVK